MIGFLHYLLDKIYLIVCLVLGLAIRMTCKTTHNLIWKLEVMNGHDGGILSQLTVLCLRKGYDLIFYSITYSIKYIQLFV